MSGKTDIALKLRCKQAVCLSAALLAAAMPLRTEPVADWQEFPSLALTQARVLMHVYPGNLTCIARPKGPQQARSSEGYKDPPFVPRTAGLDGFIAAPEPGRKGIPEWTLGVLIPDPFKGWGLNFDLKTITYLSPVAAPRKAGRITLPEAEELTLLDQNGDWTHNRLVFRGATAGGAADEKSEMRITVSRLCPGILIETDASSVSFFDGVLGPEELFYIAARNTDRPAIDGLASEEWRKLPENTRWLLVFHGALRPDTATIAWGGKQNFSRDMGPVLMAFSAPPVTVERGDGLIFAFADTGIKIAAMPLFGLDTPSGAETEKWKSGLPDAAIARCDRWAERLAAFPVTVRETYTRETAADRVGVHTKIEYVRLREEAAPWTPLPPAVALAAEAGLPLEFSAPAGPEEYRSAYGPLRAIDGADHCSWSITGLSKYVFEQPRLGPSTPQSEPLEQELGREIDKLLQTPWLAPWVYETRRFGPMGDVYWRMPSETAYFLAQAAPVLDEQRRSRVAGYLREFYRRFPFLQLPAMPTWEGPKRTRHLTGVTEDGAIDGLTDTDYNYYKRLGAPEKITFLVVRGLADYFALSSEQPGAEEWEAAATLLHESLLGSDWPTGFWTLEHAPELPPQARMTGLDLELPTKITNRHISNLVGYLRLARLCGAETSEEAALGWGQLSRKLALRLALAELAAWVKPPFGFSSYTENPWDPNRYSRNTPRIMTQFEVDFRDHTQSWRQSVFTPFLEMPPELGVFMRDYCFKRSADFLNAVERGWPGWWLANAASELSGDSGAGLTHPVNSHSLFLARAWILKDPGEELLKRLDVPWVERGDLFFIHKLAETIKSLRAESAE